MFSKKEIKNCEVKFNYMRGENGSGLMLAGV